MIGPLAGSVGGRRKGSATAAHHILQIAQLDADGAPFERKKRDAEANQAKGEGEGGGDGRGEGAEDGEAGYEREGTDAAKGDERRDEIGPAAELSLGEVVVQRDEHGEVGEAIAEGGDGWFIKEKGGEEAYWEHDGVDNKGPAGWGEGVNGDKEDLLIGYKWYSKDPNGKEAKHLGGDFPAGAVDNLDDELRGDEATEREDDAGARDGPLDELEGATEADGVVAEGGEGAQRDGLAEGRDGGAWETGDVLGLVEVAEGSFSEDEAHDQGVEAVDGDLEGAIDEEALTKLPRGAGGRAVEAGLDTEGGGGVLPVKVDHDGYKGDKGREDVAEDKHERPGGR